jgi:phosphoribosylamine--glycine ligase
MNILIIGSGGREHAFAWKLAQSPRCGRLFVAPGNAGTSQVASNVQLDVLDFAGIEKFCLTNKIDILLVGPEVPLVAGIKDYLRKNEALKRLIIVGPDAKGAQLEGSKDFSKNFMVKYGIPTARARSFNSTQLEEGLQYISSHPLPIVLKADGLAAGKGVIIAQDYETAISTFKEMIVDQKFGEASSTVLIEQFLDGIELSVFVLSDGEHYVILPEAKDYKRIGEKDTGPNTGGMGAVSPVPFADKVFMDKVKERIIIPTVNGLRAEGIDYTGFIFIGLIKVKEEPLVIEYNARMGDPETEAVIPRIKNDLVGIFEAFGSKKLDSIQIEQDQQAAATIILVSGGYPDSFEKGKEITGLDNNSSALIFHAGTITSPAGKVVSNGGRVIAVTGKGDTLIQALAVANETAQDIHFEKSYYRTDIGKDVI